MSAIVRVERIWSSEREMSARALSTRIFALISLVRLACKREKQTEKERKQSSKTRTIYLCMCKKTRKEWSAKHSLNLPLGLGWKENYWKNIILLIATKVEIYAVLPWEKKVSNLPPEKYFKSSRRTRGTKATPPFSCLLIYNRFCDFCMLVSK